MNCQDNWNPGWHLQDFNPQMYQQLEQWRKRSTYVTTAKNSKLMFGWMQITSVVQISL